MEFEHAHVEIGARRPLRHSVTPRMAEVEELQAILFFSGGARRVVSGRGFPRRAGLQAKLAFCIEHGDEADHASIALAPFPGKALEGAAPTGQFVDIAADVLDRRNAGFQQRPVRRIPFREIDDRLASAGFLVFRQQIFDLRAVAVRPERGRQRMIDASRVDADHFDALFHKPRRGVLAQTRRIAEIFLAVGIFPMPAGIDEDDVARLDLRLGALEVRRLDQLPFPFRYREHDSGAEEPVERQLADRSGAGNEMDRRVDVRGGMKDRRDFVRHHALFGVVRDAFELDFLVAGEDRRVHAPAMAELVKLQPAHGIDNGRHFSCPSLDAYPRG